MLRCIARYLPPGSSASWNVSPSHLRRSKAWPFDGEAPIDIDELKRELAAWDVVALRESLVGQESPRSVGSSPPVADKVQRASGAGTGNEPRDGDLDDRGRVCLAGNWLRFGPQQKRLLLWALVNQNGKVSDAVHALGLTGDDHFNKLLHDLRNTLSTGLKHANRSLVLLLEGGLLRHQWNERQRK
jgi:hypothetical protein